MTYSVIYKTSVIKYLGKIDPQMSLRIMRWIEENLAGCKDPRSMGKALHGNRAGTWRYRVGEYRVIAEIKDTELIITVIEVGPRKNIYK
jgi:mRNA interferase RelE/StbE